MQDELTIQSKLAFASWAPNQDKLFFEVRDSKLMFSYVGTVGKLRQRLNQSQEYRDGLRIHPSPCGHKTTADSLGAMAH